MALPFKKIEVLQGDITMMKVDAIVNAANNSLMGGGGVDGAIHKAGGKKILEECLAWVNKFGSLPTGSAMITSGGNMTAKYVVHTAGPVWNGGKTNEAQLLQNAYVHSLKAAVENSVSTIAFPNISTGVYRFPKELAAEIAITAVLNFLKKNASIEKVSFVCFDEENFGLYLRKLEELKTTDNAQFKSDEPDLS